MIVIEIVGTCRAHDVQERVQMRGKDTPRQLEEGYTELDRKMGRHGCTDYSKIHSVTKQPKDRQLPHLFQPRYPQPAARTVDHVNATVPDDTEDYYS